jgi:putative sterol carrier protein
MVCPSVQTRAVGSRAVAGIPEDLASADPGEVARLVRTAGDDDLAALMQSDVRPQVLDAIFTRMEQHFRADKAGGLDAVLHWKIFDRPGGGYDHYEVVLAGGRCLVNPAPSREPDLTLKAKPADFLKLVTGNASPTRMALRGRLRVQGDLTLATRVGRLFAIPRP